MSLETLDRMPDFNGGSVAPEGNAPKLTLFDVIGQDFNEWEAGTDQSLPSMDTMKSSPTTAETGKTDYDWD